MSKSLEIFRFKYDKYSKLDTPTLFMNPGFKTVTKAVEETICNVKETLKVKANIRAFVLPDNTFAGKFNAMVSKNNDILFIGITEPLLRILDNKELSFVIGHEIGHAIFGHVEIKNEYENLSSQCREISADRVGFAAVNDISVAASTIHKIKYGLKHQNVKFSIRSLMDWVKNPLKNYSTSHPIDSLRLESIIKFSMSKIYKEYINELSYVFENNKLDKLIYSKIKEQILHE